MSDLSGLEKVEKVSELFMLWTVFIGLVIWATRPGWSSGE